MKWMATLIAIFALVAAISKAQDPAGDPCIAAQESCDVCIGASYRCSWCPYLPNTTLGDNAQRCRSEMTPCPGDVEPENPLSSMQVTKDLPLSVNATSNSIQVGPQNISMSLRRGFPSAFNMTFRSLRNSPLDVYFLLDVSNSLSDILSALQEDLESIAEQLGTISTAFQMGFGTFVDKPILPIALSDYRARNPDTGEIGCSAFESCVPTYSFRNYQPLTTNISSISQALNNFAMLSSNIDSPEGGLEALLQAAVCLNETGWRPNALHMVFLITDQGYHTAGDGRVAGIVAPNDGLCHLEPLENTGGFEYTHGLLQDYPSVTQLRDILQANLIVPVFTLLVTITEERLNQSLLPTYDNLVRELRSAVQAITFQDSSVDEINRAIREAYDATVQNIRPNRPNVPGYSFDITPVDGCLNQTEEGACQLPFDREVVFQVTVTLEDCELAGSATKKVQLLGAPFSFTTITLNPLCECQCSMEEPDVNSEVCNGRGDLSCGVCTCQTDPITYFGDECECDEEISACPMFFISEEFNGNCSGRGDCTSCGTCRCFDGSFGEACQCTDDDCPNACSGNGDCTCEAIGSIPTCECDTINLGGTVFSFFQSRVGNPGNCMCNPANCHDAEFPGDLCHNVQNNTDGREFCRCTQCLCPDGLTTLPGRNICIPQSDVCQDNRDCARCRAGDTAGRNCDVCNLDAINEIELGFEPASPLAACEERVDNCVYIFFVEAGPGGQQILSFTRSCTTSTLPWIIAGSLVGAIIVLGLLFLIILKVCLVVCDRIEYRRFIQEFKEADFAPHENPLYLTPQQDYQNPALRVKKPVVTAEVEPQ